MNYCLQLSANKRQTYILYMQETGLTCVSDYNCRDFHSSCTNLLIQKSFDEGYRDGRSETRSDKVLLHTIIRCATLPYNIGICFFLVLPVRQLWHFVFPIRLPLN